MNIIITGASKGMGKATAEKFAEEENTLFICARSEKELAATALELSEKYPGSKTFYTTADLTDTDSVKNFAAWVLKNCDRIDVLVNNAGTFIPGSIFNEEEGTLEKMLKVNLYSAYNVTRAFLPKMMEQKQGHIFNICSIASLQAYTNGGSYSISKFALMGFSKNLREEMKPYNIKVTSVYPGAVYTSSWFESGVSPARIMEASDIAEIIYSASQLSPQACIEDIVIRPVAGDI
jgi:short-subunit dehydrogenase